MPQNEASEQETRLRRIIQKQEAKLKSIWDENKRLIQQAELAQLDYEIANEQSHSLQDELESVQSKLKELEELRSVSEELEASYAADNRELRQKCELLQSQLSTTDISAQSLETVRLELRDSRRLLQVAKLEINIMKHGVVKALGPPLESTFPHSDFLYLIDHLSLDIDPVFSRFRDGDISLATLGQKLSDMVDKALLDQSLVESANVPESNPHLIRLREAKEKLPPKAPEAPIETSQANNAQGADLQLIQTYKLRISVLESKLKQAESISIELEKLENTHQVALRAQEEQKQKLSTYMNILELKEAEIAALKKRNLPAELQTALHETKVASLSDAIKFLSTRSPAFELQNLDITPQPFISAFAKNHRVRRFRKLALSLKLGATRAESRDLALEQRLRLSFL